MKYPYNAYMMCVQGHSFWVAESKSLKGCAGQGNTADEAVAELELNEEEWLKTAKEYGLTIPAVQYETEESYSGNFTVRVSPSVHQAASEEAKKQGISLNQYVNDAIVEKNTKSLYEEGIKKGLEVVKQSIGISHRMSKGVRGWNYSFAPVVSSQSVKYS